MIRSRRRLADDLRAFAPEELVGNFRFANDGAGSERIIAMFPRDQRPFFQTAPGVAKMRYAAEMMPGSGFSAPHTGVAAKKNEWTQWYLDPAWDSSVWLECHGSPWGSPSLFFQNPNTGNTGRAPYIAHYHAWTPNRWWEQENGAAPSSWRLHVIVKTESTDNNNRVFYTDRRSASGECLEIGYNGSTKKLSVTYGEPSGQSTVSSAALTDLIPDDGWMRFTLVVTHYGGLFELSGFRVFMEDVEIITHTTTAGLSLWHLSYGFKYLGADNERKDTYSWSGWIAQALWIENHPASAAPSAVAGFEMEPSLESWLHPWLEDPWFFLRTDDIIPAPLACMGADVDCSPALDASVETQLALVGDVDTAVGLDADVATDTALGADTDSAPALSGDVSICPKEE